MKNTADKYEKHSREIRKNTELKGILLLVAKCQQVGVNLKSGTLPSSLSCHLWFIPKWETWKTQQGNLTNTAGKYEKRIMEIWKTQQGNLKKHTREIRKNTELKYEKHSRELWKTQKGNMKNTEGKCENQNGKLKNTADKNEKHSREIWQTPQGNMKNTNWEYEKHSWEIWKTQKGNIKNTA